MVDAEANEGKSFQKDFSSLPEAWPDTPDNEESIVLNPLEKQETPIEKAEDPPKVTTMTLQEDISIDPLQNQDDKIDNDKTDEENTSETQDPQSEENTLEVIHDNDAPLDSVEAYFTEEEDSSPIIEEPEESSDGIVEEPDSLETKPNDESKYFFFVI